jgi:Domain of unknown function (DUF4328)
MGDEVWICSSCRSVNTRRSGQCYSCHAWRDAVAVAPKDVGSLGSVVAYHAAAPAPIGHAYRSARWRAMVASLLIIVVAVTLPVLWWYTNRSLGALADGDTQLASSIMDEERPILVAYVGLVVLAFVAWAAWLSRVVDNLPALGVGYSRATPRMAFIESVIPVFNLFRLPVRVREVTRLLHPQGEGDGLIAAGWLVMFAGWVILAVGFRLLVAQQMIDKSANVLPTFSALRAIALFSTSIGLFVVVAVIRRVEALSESRARGLSPAGATHSQSAMPTPSASVAADLHPTPSPDVSWRTATARESAPVAAVPAAAMPPDASPPVQREPASHYAGDRTVQFLAERAAARPPIIPGPTDSQAGEPKAET